MHYLKIHQKHNNHVFSHYVCFNITYIISISYITLSYFKSPSFAFISNDHTLYHCTINTVLHCLYLFSFLTVQHHSHALVGKYNYHIYLTFICIHFSVITQVFFICIPSFNVITLFILHCTLFPELSTRMQYFQCHNPVFITSHLRAITLSHF